MDVPGAVLEEHVDQLPHEVVRRLQQLLRDERVGDVRDEAPLVAGVRERHRQAAVVEVEHDVVRLGQRAELLGRERERRQRPLADDHRVHELDRHVAGVRACGRRAGDGEQPPAGLEALGARVAEPRDPLGLGGEEALARRGPFEPQTRPTSQRRHSSIPSPVFALVRIRSTPGLTASRWYRKRSRSKSRCGSRSILLITTSSQARNISGYLSGLSSPSATEATIARTSSPIRNSAGQTRLPTFSTTSRSMSSSGIAGSAERTMFASRWHSPPKPLPVLSCTTGTCSEATRSASRLPCTSPSSTPARTPSRSPSAASSSDVLPAPGALMRFTTATPARSKSSRLARAIVLLASSASSTTLTFTRCTALHRLDLEVAGDLGRLGGYGRDDRRDDRQCGDGGLAHGCSSCIN